MRRAHLIAVSALLACSAIACHAAEWPTSEDCGDPFQNGVGPYDYNSGEARTNPQKIPIVERHHFTPVVESLARGQSTSYVMGDLDYTLRAVPNHHRALQAVVRYELRERKPDPRFRDAKCWLERASMFAPRDGVVQLIYGMFLARQKSYDAALERYLAALDLIPESSELHYNMGLLYFEMKDHAKALEHAQRAYALGYPLEGLKSKLIAAGKWSDGQ
jgi:tetratricopeptide (TPR) repeat protein